MSHEQWSGFNSAENTPNPEQEFISPFAVLAERYGFSKDKIDAILAGNEFVATHLEEGERPCVLLIRLMKGEDVALAHDARALYNRAIEACVGADKKPRAEGADFALAVAKAQFMYALEEDESCGIELEAARTICLQDGSRDWSEDLHDIEALMDELGF